MYIYIYIYIYMLLQVCAYMITVLTYIDNTALFIIMHYLLLYIFFVCVVQCIC